MTWLDVGNGWRNLFLLSCGAQALALGIAFAIRRLWVRESRLGAFLAGASVTPFAQMLWMLLMALVWPNAPRLMLVAIPPALACGYLLIVLLRRVRRLRALSARAWAWLRGLCRLDRPALVSLCFALAMAILLLPICVRAATSTVTAQADGGEYMGLAVRYCEDRDFSKLLDKEDATGHFRGHSHFPSMELYLSYGLMHGTGDYGYPSDKPMFTGVGLLVFYLLAAYFALCIRLSHGQKRWLLLAALLFNLVPEYVFCLSGSMRDTWRCMATLSAAVALSGLDERGGWRSYLGKLCWMALLCFTAMSAHVVCFVVLPFMVVAWTLWRWGAGVARCDGHAGRTLLRAVGLSLAGAAGTLVAFSGNLRCYLKWGTLSPWRLMTTFTDAPWYEMYMANEFKLEETTTHLNFWESKYDIVMSYATPIGLWGMRLALVGLLACAVALIVRRARARRERLEGSGLSSLAFASLLTLLTLAPMTGLLDTKLYSFSGSFLKMQRYTLQWFMLASACIASALSALEAAWPRVCARLSGRLGPSVRRFVPRVPAYLCALLCVFAFAQGTSERGYADTMYRYGRSLLTDESIAQDNSFQARYAALMKLDALLADDQKLLLTRPGYQYAVHGRGYILTANPIVPLMNLREDEIAAALAEMNVAALATEAKFWDERYYAKSTLSDYLNALPAAQIVEVGEMRFYLVDVSLAAPFAEALGARDAQ